ncbi:hypothetical protein ACQR1V_08940 [Bradyrhizobium oligotrophicum]|uniref:hypothetical protein n=1 Tax=Bradyrhizobium oligotrophicum TaxID=44255 RepID=UPI003EBF2A4C
MIMYSRRAALKTGVSGSLAATLAVAGRASAEVPAAERAPVVAQDDTHFARISSLSDLKMAAENDRGLPKPRFSSVLSNLLEDHRVTSLLESRFAQNECLHSAADAGVVDDLGLIKTLFLFFDERSEVSKTGLMVLSDANCQVAAVLKDFDPIHPNPYLPPLPYTDPTPEIGIDPFYKNIEPTNDVVPFLLRHETVFLSKEDFPERYKRFMIAAEKFNSKYGIELVGTTWCTKGTRECTGSAPTLNTHPDDIVDCRNVSDSYACDSM